MGAHQHTWQCMHSSWQLLGHMCPVCLICASSVLSGRRESLVHTAQPLGCMCPVCSGARVRWAQQGFCLWSRAWSQHSSMAKAPRQPCFRALVSKLVDCEPPGELETGHFPEGKWPWNECPDDSAKAAVSLDYIGWILQDLGGIPSGGASCGASPSLVESSGGSQTCLWAPTWLQWAAITDWSLWQSRSPARCPCAQIHPAHSTQQNGASYGSSHCNMPYGMFATAASRTVHRLPLLPQSLLGLCLSLKDRCFAQLAYNCLL